MQIALQPIHSVYDKFHFMPPYAYPIIIKREPQLISYQKEIELGTGSDSVLTLAKLREHGVTEEHSFWTYETDEGLHSTNYLIIAGERLETPEELKIRIEKEEAYMVEYNKRKQTQPTS